MSAATRSTVSRRGPEGSYPLKLQQERRPFIGDFVGGYIRIAHGCGQKGHNALRYATGAGGQFLGGCREFDARVAEPMARYLAADRFRRAAGVFRIGHNICGVQTIWKETLDFLFHEGNVPTNAISDDVHSLQKHLKGAGGVVGTFRDGRKRIFGCKRSPLGERARKLNSPGEDFGDFFPIFLSIRGLFENSDAAEGGTHIRLAKGHEAEGFLPRSCAFHCGEQLRLRVRVVRHGNRIGGQGRPPPDGAAESDNKLSRGGAPTHR